MQRARGWCGRSLTVNKKPLRARQSVDVALVTADTSEGLFLTVDVCPLRRVTSKREVPCLRHALPELQSEAPLGSWPPELGSRLCGSEQPRPALPSASAPPRRAHVVATQRSSQTPGPVHTAGVDRTRPGLLQQEPRPSAWTRLTCPLPLS